MLLVLFYFLVQAWAAPVSMGPQTTPTLAHMIIWGIERRDTGIVERTLYQVIRGCFVTIAACVYRAIHQNIPDPKMSWGKRQAIRIKITFFALMAPEAVIWWAMRQWIAAKEIAEQVNKINPELEWTRTHGFFLQMGGLGRLGDEHVLYPNLFIWMLKRGEIDMDEIKRVSKKKIEDSSKGDVLSKGIVALQTIWFVFECLVRLHQGLPLIELEVVTLAYAALNTLTYIFWWYKPLDILCPIYLHVQPPSEDRPSSSSEPSENQVLDGAPKRANFEMEEANEEMVSAWKRITRPLLAVFIFFWGLIKGTILFVWDGVIGVIAAVLNILLENIDEYGLWGAMWRGILGPFIMVGLLVELMDLFGEDDEDSGFQPKTHVPTFYGKKLSQENFTLVVVLSCFIGMCFGGIHFLAWHSPFATHTQLILWRVSSILMVAIPFGIALERILLPHDIDFDDMNGRGEECVCLFEFFGTMIAPFIYVFARLSIFVLTFLALHHLPQGALEAVSWTGRIPHL